MRKYKKHCFIKNEENEIYCSKCGNKIMDDELAMKKHASSCGFANGDFAVVYRENKDYAFTLEKISQKMIINIYTPVLAEKKDNGYSGGEWKVVYTAIFSETGEFCSEAGLHTHAIWRRMHMRRLDVRANHQPVLLETVIRVESTKGIINEKEKPGNEKKEIVKENVTVPRCIQIKRELDECVYGQEKAKKVLSLVVDKFLRTGDTEVVLLKGPTGSGKTFLMETLAECDALKDKVRVHTVDGSQLTPAGFTGMEVADIFKAYRKSRRSFADLEKKGIIFIDEIDKILRPNHDSNGENVNAMVQGQLLAAIQGAEIDGFNTKEFLFVFGGAFSDLDKAEKKKKDRRYIGIQTQEQSGINRKVYGMSLRDKMLEAGAEPEFMGRVSTIVELDQLDRAVFHRILCNEKNGVIAKKQKEFASYGVTLEIEETVIDALLDLVERENLGGRSVRNILNEILEDRLFDCIEKGYTGMTIHLGVVLNGEEPFYHSKDEKRKVK